MATASEIRAVYDSGKWRGAYQTLQGMGASVFQEPELLVLWLKCKSSLSERGNLDVSFRSLLTLPGTTAAQAKEGYQALPYGEMQARFAPELLRWVESHSLTEAQRAEIFEALPIEAWDADRLFAAIAATTSHERWDALVTETRRRFASDPRMGTIKPRPEDPRAIARAAYEKKLQEKKDKIERDRIARTEVEKLIRENRDLEAAILAAPEDEQRYRVYGDWLQQENDPRGELIAVQAELLHRKGDEALTRRESEILERIRPALLGEAHSHSEVEWYCGFIRKATVWADHEKDLVDPPLRDLLRLPAGRFIRELVVGNTTYGDNCEYEETIATLVEMATALPLLSLFLGDFDAEECELSWCAMGAVEPLYAAFPRLQSLRLRAGSMKLGKIDMPELRSFAAVTGGLIRANIQSICNAVWPKLESLEIWFGDPNYGAEGGIDDIAPILNGSGIDRVKHLGLCNAIFTNEICEEIVRAPVLKQLESLDLSHGCMTLRGANALLDHRDALAHLRRLNVSGNCLDEDTAASLRPLCAEVIVADQDPARADDGAARYPAVGE